MNGPPLVSVVVPSLNRANFLKPTLESILEQDYPKIECIVVDGGSTDGTLEILRSYGDRIRWISEPDHGQSDAINKGWKMSRGQIVTWLNADDRWKIPDAVSQAVRFLQDHEEVDVVYGKSRDIDPNGNELGMTYCHTWDLDYSVEYCDHCIPQPASFIRRLILEKVGLLDVDFHQRMDYDLWLRIGLVGKIQHLPVSLALTCNERGVSFQKEVSTVCVRIMEKFFALPGVPERLLGKKARAMSNAYLRGVQYAWEGGRHFDVMVEYTFRAIMIDLSNVFRVAKLFLRFLKLLVCRSCVLAKR